MSTSKTVSPLVGKIIISGKIKAETALHIGGSKDGLDIGGVDLNVIKTYDGRPLIPGSSLKGKLRSMLARIEGSNKIANPKNAKNPVRSDEHVKYLRTLFGLAGDESQDGEKQELTRLIVRDAFLDLEESPNQTEYDQMDFLYTDVKFENSIDRKRGVAEHPRQLERVPAGAYFKFELIVNVHEEDLENYEPEADEKLPVVAGTSGRDQMLNALGIAMQLLHDDYLGGHGSRGYGKISFSVEHAVFKQIDKETYKYEVSDNIDQSLKDSLDAFTTHFPARKTVES